MFHIAVAEDDPESREKLKGYLDRFQREKNIELETSFFADGLDLTDDYRPVFQVLLLDIEMPHLDGLEAARRIREVDQDAVILFITNMARYAIRGYEVQAMDFVLKPVSYFAFAMKMDKALAMVTSRRQDGLLVTTEDGIRKVAASDITFLEMQSHRLLIHTTEGTFTSRETLQAMEEKLRGHGFVRCNKGYLVNLKQISLVKKDTVIVGGQELLISRRKKEEFMKALTDYYGGGMV